MAQREDLHAAGSPASANPSTAGLGLTSLQAAAALTSDGPNAMLDTSAHLLRSALSNFWAPVPWLPEASMALQLMLLKYAVRDRQHVWGLLPSEWLVLTSAADVLFIALLANRGIEMSALPLRVLMLELSAALLSFLIMNFVKLPLFRRLSIT